jgi:hypothetical protein
MSNSKIKFFYGCDSLLKALSNISGLSEEDIDKYCPMYVIYICLRYLNKYIPEDVIDGIKSVIHEHKEKILLSGLLIDNFYYITRKHEASSLVPMINLLNKLTKKREYTYRNIHMRKSKNMKISIIYDPNRRCIDIVYSKKQHNHFMVIFKLSISLTIYGMFDIVYSIIDIHTIVNPNFSVWLHRNNTKFDDPTIVGLSIDGVINWIKFFKDVLE